ncbi:tetratricopeptide repeat protein [uncultured Sunxiuqinia sp.]|uniref:tetratricopeptide repeat protein n=1 Tax=uncultured Sunxiuqinia sp. TaxID=1573825 RepID=UPI002AA6988E|nr:tetratricopeptide repeat protein [uncultured Sunxiuqinia sp.]
MQKQIKRQLLFIGILAALLMPSTGFSQQIKMDANKMQLANQYYRSQDFEKAAVLYQEIYASSGSQHYFNLYLNCLIEMGDFEQAEKDIEKQLRKRNNDPYLYVQWGYLLKQQNLLEAATEKFDQAIQLVSNNKTDYIQLANAFLSRREYEFAQQTYQLGRNKLNNEAFHYELARVYLYQRNYELMFQEYLELLKEDDTNLGRVQSSMLTAFRMDVDNSLRDEFRTALLRRIQQNPNVIAYNHLLIWLLVQEKRFSQALRQSIALDKRIGEGDGQIDNLARVAAGNEGVDEAIRAYNYLIEKGTEGEFYEEAYSGKMQMLYRQFVDQPKEYRHSEILKDQFEEAFKVIGFTTETTPLVIDYAHFLAFYQNRVEEATELLYRHMKISDLGVLSRGRLKNELADIHVLKDDLWEAILLYSQIIDANKNNPLGDEIKLKKARLGYFMGNLSWAQAQLDVLKGSTSKLIANDALELSVFISNNIALDTTTAAMELFAKADLYSFRNQDSLAWLTLDSIENKYSYNSLLDDVYFRKAKTLIKQGDYGRSIDFLTKIKDEFAYDLLGDDAMFLLGEIYETQLNKDEQAAELFKEVLTRYPGSIYVEEARSRYRRLRAEVPVEEEAPLQFEPEIN